MNVQSGNGYVIVVGGGRVGRHTAAELSENGCAVTIIEREETKAERVPEHIAKRVIVGDGAEPEVLKRADPEKADVVAGLTNDTDTNLSVCKLAREVSPGLGTLARTSEDGEQDYAHLDYVDTIVYPAMAGASVAADRVDRSLLTGDR